jgi:protoheme IX farnesyltransferase
MTLLTGAATAPAAPALLENFLLQGDRAVLMLPAARPLDMRLLLDLFKLRIGVVIALTALAGLAVTAGPALPAWRIAALVLAQVCGACAAGAYNQIRERDIDGRMRRTARRAFVTGRLQAGPAWSWGLGLLGAAGVVLAALALNAMTALYTFLGAFTYAVVYTAWLKRRTAWNIVVGGLAGSFAVLAGGAAVAPHALQPLTLSYALVLFLWTPPHFWSLAIACHEDYAAARVPMLPVVIGDARAARVVFGSAVLLVLAALLPAWLGMGRLYLATALGAGGYLLARSYALLRQPGRAAALANFRASLVYLTLLIGATFAEVLLPT